MKCELMRLNFCGGEHNRYPLWWSWHRRDRSAHALPRLRAGGRVSQKVDGPPRPIAIIQSSLSYALRLSFALVVLVCGAVASQAAVRSAAATISVATDYATGAAVLPPAGSGPPYFGFQAAPDLAIGAPLVR